MDTIVIWEATEIICPSVEFVIIICITIVFSIVYFLCVLKKYGIDGKIFFGIVEIVLQIITFSLFYSFIDEHEHVWKTYKNDEYSKVEGIVEEYSTEYSISGISKYDYFQISNTYFLVPDISSSYGYPFTKSNGGVIDNGMHLIIYYIPYKQTNIIMKIEQLP